MTKSSKALKAFDPLALGESSYAQSHFLHTIGRVSVVPEVPAHEARHLVTPFVFDLIQLLVASPHGFAPVASTARPLLETMSAGLPRLPVVLPVLPALGFSGRKV